MFVEYMTLYDLGQEPLLPRPISSVKRVTCILSSVRQAGIYPSVPRRARLVLAAARTGREARRDPCLSTTDLGSSRAPKGPGPVWAWLQHTPVPWRLWPGPRGDIGGPQRLQHQAQPGAGLPTLPGPILERADGSCPQASSPASLRHRRGTGGSGAMAVCT